MHWPFAFYVQSDLWRAKLRWDPGTALSGGAAVTGSCPTPLPPSTTFLGLRSPLSGLEEARWSNPKTTLANAPVPCFGRVWPRSGIKTTRQMQAEVENTT
ncbi:hypothetical protein K443DRAFT_679098 [Laccaria amethystina LaAM-08-1]|uniref:Uncharacterized protein n=1 Tax=Laccaria amethystina LaAM-08-1 TaxID=1095629 RepID=A0A0C9WQH6_9AGAR|nr:hypothetical protein K443DRAFT_679098 [Laccaria amethystina LaAM-08-1]